MSRKLKDGTAGWFCRAAPIFVESDRPLTERLNAKPFAVIRKPFRRALCVLPVRSRDSSAELGFPAGLPTLQDRNSLCRGLCRNPAILTGIARDYSVSFCVTCQRHDVCQGRMDIGSPYHLLSFRVAPSDSGSRFDTVEVRSSSLLVPTISITKQVTWNIMLSRA